MKEVSKDQFYEVINPQDVMITIQAPARKHRAWYEGTSIFKLRYGGMIGKIISERIDGKLTNKYFVK